MPILYDSFSLITHNHKYKHFDNFNTKYLINSKLSSFFSEIT